MGGEILLKRSLTGIAAAAVVLGAMSPMAFAATSKATGLTKASQLPIVVNGKVLSNPYEMTGKDSGNTTGFFPIYYFNQALAKIGFTATWDGTTHTWAITAPGVTPSAVAGGVGTGNTTVTVNGTVVKKFNTQVAKDPAGGPKAQATTYLPIYYIQNVLSALGVTGNFSGQTGLSITTATNTTGSSLSPVTASGATSGTGSEASPAVSLNDQKVTLSTTLTDANGNPVSGTAVNFRFSQYGNFPTSLPTVTDTNGTVLSGTSSSNYETYTAYTNASGVASVIVEGPAGQTYAYEVVAVAPYQGSTGSDVTSTPAYVEFVANNEAAISPYGTSSSPFKAALGSAVPITVALPTDANGNALANELITLTATSASGAAYFTNSAGADLGQTIQVSTNASGIATAMLNDSNAEQVTVAATLPAGLGVNNPQASVINFAQAGIATQVDNYSISATSGIQAGQNVTVSGTLVDAAGNPVANGQVLVVGNDNNDSGDFGYISNGSVVDFPENGLPSNGEIALAQGMSANSNVGDVVTADANGNFSFQLTDTDDNEDATFSIYAIQNGEVASSTPVKSDTISFSAGTTLDAIALGGTDSQAINNTYTSLTGLSASDDAQTPVWVDPQNAAGNPLTKQSLNYSVSVDNGGTVAGITANGQTLSINPSNPGLASVTVSVQYNSSSDDYTITVPGVTGSITTSTPDFAVDVYNSNTGATNLTITSGAVKSTAAFTFTGGNPTYAQNVSPVSSNLVTGQSEKVTYTVEDDQGNPVANTEVSLYSSDANDPLWITQVNGVALQQTESLGADNGTATEPTPIPLGTVKSDAPLYKTVSLSGVAAWSSTNANQIYVYTDANGQVSLTLQNGGVSYFATGNQVETSVGPTSPSAAESFWTYAKKTTATSTNVSDFGQLVIGNSGDTLTGASGATATIGSGDLFSQSLGTINLGGGSTTPGSSNSGVTVTGKVTTTGVANTAGVAYVNYGSATTTGDSLTLGTQTFSYGTSFTSEAGLISAINAANAAGLTTVTAKQDASSSNVIDLMNSAGTPVTLAGSTNLTIGSETEVPAAAGGTDGVYTLTVTSGAVQDGTLSVVVDGHTVSVPVTQFESASDVAAAIASAVNTANIDVTAANTPGSAVVTFTQNSPSATQITVSVNG